jgi:predicted ATPase
MPMRAICSGGLGSPDRAVRESAATLSRIDALGHPPTSVLLPYLAWYHHQAGDRAAAAALARRTLRSAEQHGILALVGSASALVDLTAEKLPAITELDRLARRIADGPWSRTLKAMLSSILVELMLEAGDAEAASRVLASIVNDDDDHLLAAETHRLRGVLALRGSARATDAAERSFGKAIEVACEQGARSFQLRAATNLARLWMREGKRDEARLVLGEIYGWFTEGLGSADLRAAKSLLEVLA